MPAADMGYQYYKDFPERHRRQQLRCVAWSTGCLIPFLGLSGAGVLVYGTLLAYMPSWVFVLGLLFFVSVLFYFVKSLAGSIRDDLTGRIVPYFKEHVGLKGLDAAFWSGEELARNCRQLDQLAEKHGVSALSSFGYCDDRSGERLTWHNTADGIETISSLEAHLSEIERDRTAREGSAILDELKRMRNALAKAGDKNIPFCLILRNGLDRFISPMEMDQRKGSFW
jgi:hypothetical protein